MAQDFETSDDGWVVLQQVAHDFWGQFFLVLDFFGTKVGHDS